MFSKLLFFSALTAVTILAFIPTYAPLPEVVSFSDILNHFTAFTVLFFLHLRAYPAVPTRRRIFLLIAYGIFIEAVQYFLPARSASTGDIAVDTAAVFFAALVQPLLPYFSLRAA